MINQFKLLALSILSITLIAEPAQDSDYAKHDPYFSLKDAVNDTLGQPRMILCFMSKLRPDLMVTREGEDYLALVDQAACDEAGQVSSGPQSSGGAASAAANSQSTAISYTEVIVNAARASSAEPMVVKAWVPNNDGGEEMTIYTYTEATGGVTDSSPFGEFLMRFTGTTDSGVDFFKGYLQASGSSLVYGEEMVDSFSGQTLTSRAIINLGEGDTGNGAVEGYVFDENGSVRTRTDVFAYNEEAFCRKKIAQNGSLINGTEKCFSTDESRGTKEVFGYYLYDPASGKRFDLPRKGFRVKYNNKYGFADAYGIHFDEETSNNLTSGLTIVREDDDPKLNGKEYSTYFLGGKLKKRIVSKKSLESFDGLSFVSFLSNITDLGLVEPGEYKMYYSSSQFGFVVTHKNTCGQNGCIDQALNTEVLIPLSTYLADQSRFGIFGYMQGIGGIGISLDAMKDPSNALVTSEIETDVLPSDYPETLYCTENCPTYTNIQAMLGSLESGDQISNNGPFENYNSFGVNANSVVTYSLNPETGVYTAGDGGDAVFDLNLSDEIKASLGQTQFGFGAYSGALVTSLGDLTCEFEEYDYCSSSIQSGAVEIYYQWVTSPDRWNQYRGLVDDTGRLVSFSNPINVYFNAPDNVEKYKEFAGKELRLEFAGGDQLWGIPGGCVNNGVYTEDCVDTDDDSKTGYLPWVDKFTIPPSVSEGKLFISPGQIGHYYLAKPAFGVVILKKAPSYIGTLTLGSSEDLPTLELVNIGPNGPSYIGSEPNKPSTVSVVHGLNADEAASFDDSNTGNNNTLVGNNAPIFETGSYEFIIDENETSVTTILAVDPDGDVVSYSLSGFSSSGLDINSVTGILSFNSAPDFESKQEYNLTVIATDGENSTIQEIKISINDVDDKAPIITSSRFFSYDPSSDSSLIGTVTAIDDDSSNTNLKFLISGEDLSIDETSGQISFAITPTESSYEAVVTVTDGTNSTSQAITVFIGGNSNGGGSGGSGGGNTGGGSGNTGGGSGSTGSLTFTGKTIDGYISGAKVFIDQNFNFKFDEGELFSTTDSNGEFTIGTDDENLYQCLQSRPIIADIPVGALDSTLGEVTKAYQMILPSINDAGTSAIVISPFTSLLASAVIEGKKSSGIKEDIPVDEGCSATADIIAQNISNELSTLYADISANFDIDAQSLISDFIANSSETNSSNDSSESNSSETPEISFEATFGGAINDPSTNTFTFPTGAEAWAGFANATGSASSPNYPITIGEDSKIQFNASAPNGDVDVYFTFWFDLAPNINPLYQTEAITISGAEEKTYEISIPSQGNNTFRVTLLYLLQRDTPVEIKDIKIIGNTESETSAPKCSSELCDLNFSGVFGDLDYNANTNTYLFPSYAQPWAGAANENYDGYPLSFTKEGKISFTASIPESITNNNQVAIKFAFERKPYPDNRPIFYTETAYISGPSSKTYEISIPPYEDEGITFESILLYIETLDTPVIIKDVTLSTDSQSTNTLTSSSSKVTEETAQNIASLFPYTKLIDQQVSEFLTNRYKKSIRANVALSKAALDIVFGDGVYEKLPLSFSSRYETNKNPFGWYQTEELSASNGYISKEGILSREHCSSTDTVGCDLSEITLENVANTSTSYSRQSNFLNQDIEIAGLKTGSLAVYAFDNRSWRDNSVDWQDNRARECQNSNDIQFQIPSSTGKQINFHYSSYSQGYRQFDCSGYRKYYFPKLNIATIMNQSVNDNSFQANYYIPDIVRTGIISNAPYDFIENQLTIDPTNVIAEMAQLPTFFKDTDEIRRMFNSDDYMLFEYHHNPYVDYFEFDTVPRNDYFKDGQSGQAYRGQEARDAMFSKLQTEETFDESIYGNIAPRSKVIGKISKPFIEIIELTSEQTLHPIFPIYNAKSKTLDYSLNGASFDLDNIKNIVTNSINANNFIANFFFSPDDTVTASIPLKLFIHKGSDDVLDPNESYFEISFAINVSSNTNGQTIELPVGSEIVAKYFEDDLVITKTIINNDADILSLTASDTSNQPEVSLSLLRLVPKVTGSLPGIEDFFNSEGEYFYKLDLTPSGHSIIDYDRNTVDIIQGSFSVSKNSAFPINAHDLELNEGQTKNLCFWRSAESALSPTTLSLSFSERDRPGRGALADDFRLSSNEISFASDETQSCITVTANDDVHFDWMHEAFLDISNPTNGQSLSRNQVRIRITDSLGSNNRIGGVSYLTNSAPIINSKSSYIVGFDETQVGKISAFDPDGGAITWFLGGEDVDFFSINENGVLAFDSPTSSESKSVYRISVGAREIDSSKTTTKDVSIILQNLESFAPVITSSDVFSAVENSADSFGSIIANDPNNDQLTYSSNSAEILIDSTTGSMSFKTAPDYEIKSTYSTKITVTDGTYSDSQNIVVSITNINDNFPTFVSTGGYEVTEGSKQIGPVLAADIDGDTLVFSIDSNEISISTAGVLAFIEAPDYETKNAYSAVVSISDGIFSSNQNINITILDSANESPPLITTTSFTVNENQTEIGDVGGYDADGDSLTYSLISGDIDNISISSNGVLSFLETPDYEEKSTYNFALGVSDGFSSNQFSIEILLNDVCDFEFIENGIFISSKVEDKETRMYGFKDSQAFTSRYVGKFSLNSSDYDVCAAPNYEEIFDISITGPDAAFFTLSADKANDYDRYYVYLSSNLDFDNPQDEDGNNIYEFAITAELDGVTKNKNLTLSITNEYEFGRVNSLNFNQNTEQIEIEYETDHDLPDNTAYLGFNVRGPSAPRNWFNSPLVEYSSEQSLYSIKFSYADLLGNDNNRSDVLWGGYYQVFSVDAFDSSGEIIETKNVNLVLGDVTKYVQSNSGINLAKINSLDVGINANVANGNNQISFAGSIAGDIGYIDTANTRGPGNDIRLSIAFMRDGYVNNLSGQLVSWFIYPTFQDNGDGTFTASFDDTQISEYLASGKHDYRIRLLQRGYNGSNYYTYIYPEELIRLGLVDSFKTFLNPFDVKEDYSGPAINSISPINVQCLEDDPNHLSAQIYISADVSDLNLYPDIQFTFKDSQGNDYYQSTYGTGGSNIVSTTVTLDVTEDSVVDDFIIYLHKIRSYDSSLNGTVYETGSNLYQSPDPRSINLLNSCSIQNVPPKITSDSTFKILENQLEIGKVIAEDLNGDKLIYTISEQDDIKIDQDTGQLTFINAPNYELKSIYELEVAAIDTSGEMDAQQIQIIILDDPNEAPNQLPTITSGPEYFATENNINIGTATAEDPEGSYLSWVMSDGSSIIGISESGALYFINIPDYEKKSSYGCDYLSNGSGDRYAITVNDGEGQTTQEICVRVSDVTNPVFTSSPNHDADELQTVIGNVTAQGDGNLTYSMSDGSSVIDITASGSLYFLNAPDYETKASYGCDYINTNGASGDRYAVTVTDGTYESTQEICVTVNDIAERPYFTSQQTFLAKENQTSIGIVTAADPNGDELSFRASDGSSIIEITNDGSLYFLNAPDFETKDSYGCDYINSNGASGDRYAVTVSDGINEVTQEICVNVVDVTNVEFISDSNFTIDELQTSIGEVKAIGDGSSITFSMDQPITTAPELFISEWAEGNGNNKYLEIANFTGAEINLDDYSLASVSNMPSIVGEHEFWNPFKSGATIAHGDVWVVCKPDIDETIISQCDQFNQYLSNGDDGWKLVKGSESDYTVIDSLGDFQGDPGSGWNVCGIEEATKDHTLIKKIGVNGIANWNSSIGTNSDDCSWIVKDLNDWSNIGAHLYNNNLNEINISLDGQLFFITAPDYETQASYGCNYLNSGFGTRYAVTATDGVNSAIQEICITINDVDESPYFTSGKAYLSKENQTAIGLVTAEDPNGDELNFTLMVTKPTNYLFNGTFGDATFDPDTNTYNFPSNAQSWAGFYNTDTSEYPLTFADDNSYVSFTASVPSGGEQSVQFKFEANPFPDTIPEFFTEVVKVSGSEEKNYTVQIPEQGSNTFNQILLYITERDTPTIIKNINIVDADSSVSSEIIEITSEGLLYFLTSPNYETKTSYGCDYLENGTGESYEVTVTDGENSASQNICVNIENLTGPVFTSTQDYSIFENITNIGKATATGSGDITFDMTDGSSVIETTESGELFFLSPPDYETKNSYGCDYINNGNTSDRYAITATDSEGSATQEICVTIKDIDSVQFTSDQNFSINENTTEIGNVTALGDDGDITYTMSDGNSVIEVTANGLLYFLNAPDYETKTSYGCGYINNGDTSDRYAVTASDGTNEATQEICVTINDVAETPEITSSPNFNADENQTSIGQVIAEDPNGDDLTFRMSDGSSVIQITSAGLLSFIDIPDFETKASYGCGYINNGDTSDRYAVTVSDGENEATQEICVTINNINEFAPVIESDYTFSAAENQKSIGKVIATDGDGDSLTYQMSDGGSVIEIDNGGNLTFVNSPNYEQKTSYGCGYINNGDTSDRYAVTVSDGEKSVTQEICVNITDETDNFNAPVITSGFEFTVPENQDDIGKVIATDADGDSVSFLMSDGGSVIQITTDGNLSFIETPNFEEKTSYGCGYINNGNTSDRYAVTASDGQLTSVQEICVTITNVNELPFINGLSSFIDAEENQKSVVSVSATDPDNDTLTYELAGVDSSLFTISTAGVITFNEAPDYEAPGSASGTNTYNITVVVSDGELSTSQDINVTVTNIADQISGIAVDGYVAGATVFQDLNNDGDLDVGEPSAATNSLGAFNLTLSSVNRNAPVRIINGFDLATNEIHPSILDISVNETGTYVVSPVSTLVGRLEIDDPNLSNSQAESMIASSLGISITDSPNDSILGFDPIAYFTGSNETLASEAKPVYAANQLLMSQGGGNYSVHKYITDQVLSNISAVLTNSTGSSINLSSAADIVGIKQDAYDAIFDSYVETTLASNPPINEFQFMNNKAVITDYLDGSANSSVSYSLYGVHDGNSTLVANLVGAKLDYDNLKQILDNDGTGRPMDLSFELSSLPVGSGSTSVALRLFYGDDVIQGEDEDYLEVTLTAEWESDGSIFNIKLPANQQLLASFYDRGGAKLSRKVTNTIEDILTVDQAGVNRPASLEIKLSELFAIFPTEVTGMSNFLNGASQFTYQVELGNFTIYDHLENTFNKIQGTFEVASAPEVTVFADDIYVHENASSKDITFRLSHAHSKDITFDYAIASESTASSNDHNLAAGSITIASGDTSATLTIPVIDDNQIDSEYQEELRLNLSNIQNAQLGRAYVSAYITDGEKIMDNSALKTELANNIFKNSQQSIVEYIKAKLDASTVAMGSANYTYSEVLVTEGITSNVYAYINNLAGAYEVASESVIYAIMSKTDAYVDNQLDNFADYSAMATALTQLNSGLKGLNVSQIIGTNINTDGSFPSGQNTTSLQAAIDNATDTLVTLAADTVADVLGQDTSVNFPNANVITGTEGNDVIDGTSGSDLIATFGGTDTVNPSAGNDKILGGSGVDTLNGGDGDDHIYGYAGNDVLKGDADADKILGGKDDDTINGGAGDDDLRGEAGNDTITTGAGSDTVSGGLGDDTIIIDSM
jgi:hypothetical protein